ncbi:MAG: YceH family protein [Acidimicrobiales bacterium]
MDLGLVDIRILGCLVEKERTIPDNYPLSTNALTNACNQSSNRDPVVSYEETEVDQAMLALRTSGLARTVTGGRANKHRHVLDEAWGLSSAELALLAVLFLRGPQTIGELRTRTDRMHQFDDLDQVETTLASMADGDEPWVAKLDRVPGQKERRWTHLCDGDLSDGPATTRTGDAAMGHRAVREDRAGVAHESSATLPGSGALAPADEPAPQGAGRDAEVEALAAQVAELRADVDRLYELLGETPERDV